MISSSIFIGTISGRIERLSSIKVKNMRKLLLSSEWNNPNYKLNQAKAKLLKDEMEKLVPGITRDFIMKSGPGVDGKYNQDLHPSILLLNLAELGIQKIELNRTVSVIAKRCSIRSSKSERVEY